MQKNQPNNPKPQTPNPKPQTPSNWLLRGIDLLYRTGSDICNYLYLGMSLGEHHFDQTVMTTKGQSWNQLEGLDLILHIGRIGQLHPEVIVNIVSLFGEVKAFETLTSSNSKEAVRVSFFGTLKSFKSLRFFLLNEYPRIKIKLIPTGEVLQRKVFVRVPTQLSKKSLRSYFSSFGPLRKIELKLCTSLPSPTNHNYCFVTFEDRDSVYKVLHQREHFVLGKRVFVESCRVYQVHAHEQSSQSGLNVGQTNDSYTDFDHYQRQAVSFAKDEGKFGRQNNEVNISISSKQGTELRPQGLSASPKEVVPKSDSLKSNYIPFKDSFETLEPSPKAVNDFKNQLLNNSSRHTWLRSATIASVELRHRVEDNIRINVKLPSRPLP